MSILFAILLFSLLIFVHELGHFVAAKLSGVQVNEFSMFMGPALFKKKVGETLYSIRCIPIGGYCAMEGENEDTDNPRSFQKAAWWKRLIILVAGSFMNFLAGVLIFLILFIPAKQFVVPVIGQVLPGCTIVRQDGLQSGDRFLKIDGEKIYDSSDFSTILMLNPGDVHDIVVERNGKKVELNNFKMQTHIFIEDVYVGEEVLAVNGVTLNAQTDIAAILAEDPDNFVDLSVVQQGKTLELTDVQIDKTDFVGELSPRYGFSFTAEDATFGSKLKNTWFSCVNVVRNVRLSLQMLFTGQASFSDVSGPVGIVQIMSETAEASEKTSDALMSMLYIGGFIAINLAVMNLLPIPALDGGRVLGLLLITAIEKITRKKLDPKYEGYVHGAGMILLLGLMAIILFKDIFMIFKG